MVAQTLDRLILKKQHFAKQNDSDQWLDIYTINRSNVQETYRTEAYYPQKSRNIPGRYFRLVITLTHKEYASYDWATVNELTFFEARIMNLTGLERFTVDELKLVGYLARQILTVNSYDYPDLLNKFTPIELYDNELKLQDNSYELVTPNEAKPFTVNEMKLIGYLARQILTSTYDYPNLHNIYTPTELYDNELKLEDNSYELVTPNEAKPFTVQELYDTGYNAREVLASAAYDYSDLHNIYTPQDLYDESPSFTPTELKTVGYLARQILTSTYDYPDLHNVFTPNELYRNELILQDDSYEFVTPNVAKHFTPYELKLIGYTARQVLAIEISDTDSTNPYVFADLRGKLDGTTNAGTNNALIATEVNYDDLYTATELKAETPSFTSTEMKAGEYTATQMKVGGYTARELLLPFVSTTNTPDVSSAYAYTEFNNIYTPQDLYDESPSFTPTELKTVGYLARQILKPIQLSNFYNIFTQ